MNTVHRKGYRLAIGALLMCGGAGMGALASSLTTEALVWRAPSQVPVTEAAVPSPVDQTGAGQAWARTAFDGGLRQCPQMNAEFLAACTAEMKKLAERPALPAGSYGGPLLITKVEPIENDRAWQAQDRLETPRFQARQADYEPPPDEPAEPAFEPTPDNYPAALDQPIRATDPKQA